MVVGRKKSVANSGTRITSTDLFDELDGNMKDDISNASVSIKSDNNGLTISHVRSKSAPAINLKHGGTRRNGQHNDQVKLYSSCFIILAKQFDQTIAFVSQNMEQKC